MISTEVRCAGAASLSSQWDALVGEYGTPFHSSAFLRAFEAAGPGVHSAAHVEHFDGELVAGLPAYLYEYCPRLQYYQRQVGVQLSSQKLLVSHTLIGWFGYPLGAQASHRIEAIRRLQERGAQLGVTVLFSGIDQRDTATLVLLRECGFLAFRYQDLMVRELRPENRADPAASLPARRRHKVRQHLSRSQEQGIVVTTDDPRDPEDAIRLVLTVVAEKGASRDMLTEQFLREVIGPGWKGLEILTARTPGGEAVGTLITLTLRDTCYFWLAGHSRATLPRYRQAHALYDAGLRRAAASGCAEVQAGRAGSQMKSMHGFSRVPLLLAAWDAHPDRQSEIGSWAQALEQRYLRDREHRELDLSDSRSNS